MSALDLPALTAEAAALVARATATPPAPRLGTPAVTSIARRLDHTLLRPEATRAEIVRLADEGRALGVASVCVHGLWVAQVAERLEGSPTVACAVVGFPHGAMPPRVKAAEAAAVVAAGAREVDMVVALGLLKGGEWRGVFDDVRAVVTAAAPAGVKVILETAALTPPEIALASLLCREAGAAFVKTSTGFHPAGGASVEAVRLMAMAADRRLGVKASGGVRTRDDALRMLAAGATRLGTSSAPAILDGAPGADGY